MECQCLPASSPDRACMRCDELLCSECSIEHQGKSFCRSCGTFLEKRGERPGQVPSAPPPAVSPFASEEGQELSLVEPEAAAAADRDAAPQGDVYQGDLYQEDAYQGDVYQGETNQGDVYQAGPAGGADASGVKPPAPGTSDPGFTAMTVVFAVLGAVVGAAVWYFAGVTFEKNYSAIAILVGLFTGLGAAIGSRGHSGSAAIVAAVISLGAMVVADYVVFQEFDRQYAVELEEEQAQLIEFSEGGFSDEEVREYFAFDEEDWNLFRSETDEFRAIMREELQAIRDGDSPMIEEITFGEFVQLELFRFKTLFFFALGVGAAWRTALGQDA